MYIEHPSPHSITDSAPAPDISPAPGDDLSGQVVELRKIVLRLMMKMDDLRQEVRNLQHQQSRKQ